MPNPKQEGLINRHIEACRFIYNLALEIKEYAYRTQKKNISGFELMAQLPALKKECEWLKEINSQSLQQAISNMENAYSKFFKGNAAFPVFKKKSSSKSFRNPNGASIKISEGNISFPKFKEGVKIIIDRNFEGKIRSSTITRTPTGKYFVSVLVETGQDTLKSKSIKESTTIGIDLGLKYFSVTSDGIKTKHPRHLQKSLEHLVFLQRQHSRKKKGSKNKNKSRHKIALCHEKIANQRKDFLHKLSTELVKSHDTLCFETLKIDNMMKNHKLAQSIGSSGWGMFVEMCKYKAEWNGKNVLQIPTFQASTKLCSNCGATNHTLTLADREWDCANCLSHHDRDINAAINIKLISLKNCGGVRRGKQGELPTLVGAMNLEKPEIKV